MCDDVVYNKIIKTMNDLYLAQINNEQAVFDLVENLYSLNKAKLCHDEYEKMISTMKKLFSAMKEEDVCDWRTYTQIRSVLGKMYASLSKSADTEVIERNYSAYKQMSDTFVDLYLSQRSADTSTINDCNKMLSNIKTLYFAQQTDPAFCWNSYIEVINMIQALYASQNRSRPFGLHEYEEIVKNIDYLYLANARCMPGGVCSRNVMINKIQELYFGLNVDGE